MLTALWSVEHACSRPATLSVWHRFRYLSVLSYVQDQYLSKSSLPNAQGVLYLSPLCPQPAVLRPCTHPSESLNMFTSSAFICSGVWRARCAGIYMRSSFKLLFRLPCRQLSLAKCPPPVCSRKMHGMQFVAFHTSLIVADPH